MDIFVSDLLTLCLKEKHSLNMQNFFHLMILRRQEAKEILSSLGIKTPVSKIPFLGDVLF